VGGPLKRQAKPNARKQFFFEKKEPKNFCETWLSLIRTGRSQNDQKNRFLQPAA
jgi:hypothetical protein